MTMKIDDQNITSQLNEIRSKLKVDKAQFVPYVEKTYRDLSPEGLSTLFHDSGLLIENGKPIFVYIRDHTVTFWGTRNKVHFTVCSTLKEMKRKEKFSSRYRRTNRTDNKYFIDVKSGWKKVKTEEVKLDPCRHCLSEIGYHEYSGSMREPDKKNIVVSFEAQEAMGMLRKKYKLYSDLLRSQAKDIRSDTSGSTGYPSDWKEISKRYRESKGYICERCNKNARSSSQAHHIDGDKSNCKNENLECLCRECHSKVHAHLRPH